jgi:hypothetical protein
MNLMKYLYWILLVAAISCNNEDKGPDVSDIKVDLKLDRFDKDLFAIDTNNIQQGLQQLQAKYPTFLPAFLQYVLGIADPSTVESQLRFFLSQGRPLYDSAMRKYKSDDRLAGEFRKAFQYVKHYYPNYTVPRIITLLGPVDAFAKFNEGLSPDFMGPDFLGISLQFYLGKNFSLYEDQQYVVNVAPRFRSVRFDEEYIVPDAMRIVADDIYRDSSVGRPLIEQMIEKGKQWYMLDHFLPSLHDSLITGYPGSKLEWTEANEGNIWAQIIASENMYTIEPSTIQMYLGEAPFTQVLPEQSPGNIGQWIGWRIVQKYAEKNSLSLQQVLETPAKTIFEGAGYRPK